MCQLLVQCDFVALQLTLGLTFTVNNSSSKEIQEQVDDGSKI